jgi:hypothetical protein
MRTKKKLGPRFAKEKSLSTSERGVTSGNADTELAPKERALNHTAVITTKSDDRT